MRWNISAMKFPEINWLIRYTRIMFELIVKSNIVMATKLHCGYYIVLVGWAISMVNDVSMNIAL